MRRGLRIVRCRFGSCWKPGMRHSTVLLYQLLAARAASFDYFINRLIDANNRLIAHIIDGIKKLFLGVAVS